MEVRNPTAHRLIQSAVEKELDSRRISATRAELLDFSNAEGKIDGVVAGVLSNFPPPSNAQ